MKKIDFHIHTVSTSQDAPFEFSQEALTTYVSKAALDCIAITNHNKFDRGQYEQIYQDTPTSVFPGIEVDVAKSQILVISSGKDLDSFDANCQVVQNQFANSGSDLSLERFKEIFGDLGQYILVPHYRKNPAIDSETLAQLKPHVTAGEVSSPKKFVYCIKEEDGLVPLYFSDCRIHTGMTEFSSRQTFIDCSELSFSAIKECLRDHRKVALSLNDGNKLFQIFEDGQHLSTGLNVILGARSSGKSHTLDHIKSRLENVHYIKQFQLVARDDEADLEKFRQHLSQRQSIFSKEYLSDLQRVIEDVIDIDLGHDDRELESYLDSLLQYAQDAAKHDSFSRSKLFAESAFSLVDQQGIRTLIASTKNLVSNKEFRSIIELILNHADLVALYLALIRLHNEREQLLLKKKFVNELVQEIREKLQRKTSAPRVLDVNLRALAMNKRKIQKFEQLVALARTPHRALKRQKVGFEIVADVKPFEGAGEIKSTSRSQVAFSEAFKKYAKPYDYLQELKKLGHPVVPADFYKYLVKIEYRILNSDGLDASGGERSEFFLLDAISNADDFDVLLLDEPESSFDNKFLNKDVNELIREISTRMPVVLVTHNSTVGASIRPDYYLYAEKTVSNGVLQWRTYSGYPTDKILKCTDGSCIPTIDVVLNSLEAGPEPYEQRRVSYENLKN